MSDLGDELSDSLPSLVRGEAAFSMLRNEAGGGVVFVGVFKALSSTCFSLTYSKSAAEVGTGGGLLTASRVA